MQRSVLLLVLVGGGAAVALAAVVGWMSAHRALKPLDTMTQTALQITRTDDLSRRIPLTGVAHDEVGRLAQAFNDTLERAGAAIQRPAPLLGAMCRTSCARR